MSPGQDDPCPIRALILNNEVIINSVLIFKNILLVTIVVSMGSFVSYNSREVIYMIYFKYIQNNINYFFHSFDSTKSQLLILHLLYPHMDTPTLGIYYEHCS